MGISGFRYTEEQLIRDLISFIYGSMSLLVVFEYIGTRFDTFVGFGF